MSPRLVLFFTRGVSLADWERGGNLDRELALYRALLPSLGALHFLTYGGADDRRLAARLPGLQVGANARGLPLRAYELLLPALHLDPLRRANVLKTNQAAAGAPALRAARLLRKPLIARSGYLWSDFAAREHGPDSAPARAALAEERRLFRGADRVVVTTEAMAERAQELHGIPAARIRVIPNFVETDRFAPSGEPPDPGSLVVVGRLVRQKNVTALVEAIAGLDGMRLTVVGDGPLRGELADLAERRGVDLRLLGARPSGELPARLRRAEAFVLPSLYEGHPKALLEAMACGLPVIAADVPGIREHVRHGETAYLCGTDPAELRLAVEAVAGDQALRERLGRAARLAAEAFSLARVAELERAVIEELAP